jgi:hypothetical protein
MAYHVVFDIAETGYKSFGFAAVGLIFVAIGVVLVMLRRRGPGTSGRPLRVASTWAYGWLGFSIVWTGVAFTATYSKYVRLRRALADGTAQVVEGRVDRFAPMPVQGHAMERFCVRDKCFEYSDYGVTGGFNHSSALGGPIRLDLPVRVTFVGNDIVKLEVGQL